MNILFDNVIKDAQHIYNWAELESADLERMRGIIDVLKSCKELLGKARLEDEPNKTNK